MKKETTLILAASQGAFRVGYAKDLWCGLFAVYQCVIGVFGIYQCAD